MLANSSAVLGFKLVLHRMNEDSTPMSLSSVRIQSSMRVRYD